MSGIRYADAGMDMKKWILMLSHRFWMVLVAAAAGAVLGGIVYTVAHTVPESEREYRAVSKVYLDFATDESGQVYQEYNGYTWNDLMITDPILDLTMSYLSEDYTREEVMEATEATILSDLRLLTVTITTNHADRTDAILAATDQALEEYGSTAKEFIQIQVIQTTQASLVVADSRLVQAVVLGLVIAVAVVLLGMLLYYVLDDRILVASDVKQVTDVPFVGYIFADLTEDVAASRLQSDYDRMIAYLRKKQGEILEISVTRMDEIAAGQSDKAGNVDGVVLVVPYGKVHGTFLSYLIDQYRVQGCKIVGVAIADADAKFLSRYYGRAI
ncbi:MAG: hypothetical protein PUF03_10490 [Lachnospiraceae bacterium]|nr:hypothetical protein [Lachnospiraceae bacterium]